MQKQQEYLEDWGDNSENKSTHVFFGGAEGVETSVCILLTGSLIGGSDLFCDT